MGYQVSDFWTLTPKAFDIHRKAYFEKNNIQYDLLMTVGYLSATVVMNPKAGKLEKYLHGKQDQMLEFDENEMTEEEYNEQVINLIKSFHGIS